jgi:hypothetical protein
MVPALTTLGAILAAAEETSHTPFYVIGGALAAWAVVVGAIGVSRPDFPRGKGTARLLMALTVLLVAATLSASVLTA